MTGKEELTAPDEETEPGSKPEDGGNVVTEIEETVDLPDDFEQRLAEFTGESEPAPLPSAPEEDAEGKDVPTDDTEKPETEGPSTEAAEGTNRFKGKLRVNHEDLDVDLEGDELTNTLQKGYAFDGLKETFDKKVEEARADEAERVRNEVQSEAPEITPEMKHAVNFNTAAAVVFENEPDFEEEWQAAYKRNRRAIAGAIKSSMPDEKPRSKGSVDSEKYVSREEFDALKTERETEKRNKAETDKFVEEAAKFKQAHPRVDIRTVAKIIVEKRLMGEDRFEDAYAIHRHRKGGDSQKEAIDAARKVGKGIRANDKIPPVPVGEGSAPGPLKEPPKGASQEEVTEYFVKKQPENLKEQIENM